MRLLLVTEHYSRELCISELRQGLPEFRGRVSLISLRFSHKLKHNAKLEKDKYLRALCYALWNFYPVRYAIRYKTLNIAFAEYFALYCNEKLP